jgi:hypothetical protein
MRHLAAAQAALHLEVFCHKQTCGMSLLCHTSRSDLVAASGKLCLQTQNPPSFLSMLLHARGIIHGMKVSNQAMALWGC